jgi:hypothetical protein
MELPANADLSAFAPPGSESADKIKEQNTYRRYVWMLNEKGRKVPVAVVHVKDALSRRYTHTDRKVIDEDTSAPAHAHNEIETDPMKVMARATEQLAQSQSAMVEVMQEVTGKKPAKEPVKKADKKSAKEQESEGKEAQE